MRLLNQARRIIIVLNCNFINFGEATKTSDLVNTAEAFNTVPTVSFLGIYYFLEIQKTYFFCLFNALLGRVQIQQATYQERFARTRLLSQDSRQDFDSYVHISIGIY